MLRQSRQHLDAAGESYFTHMYHALRFSARLMGAGLALIIHALCPGWFKTTGSDAVFKLNAILQTRRERATSVQPRDE